MTPIRWKQWVRGDVEGVNVKLLRRLARIARDMTKRYHETGGNKKLRFTIYVNSGYRTRAEQEALYKQYLRIGWPKAAKPGTSRHETGNAADVNLWHPSGDSSYIPLWRLRHYGLKAPVPGERWHTELA